MVHKTDGICTMCGSAGTLTLVTNEDKICDECLETFFTQCDVCGEYYPDDIEWFCLKDDRLACEYCAEGFDEDDFAE